MVERIKRAMELARQERESADAVRRAGRRGARTRRRIAAAASAALDTAATGARAQPLASSHPCRAASRAT